MNTSIQKSPTPLSMYLNEVERIELSEDLAIFCFETLQNNVTESNMRKNSYRYNSIL